MSVQRGAALSVRAQAQQRLSLRDEATCTWMPGQAGLHQLSTAELPLETEAVPGATSRPLWAIRPSLNW